MSEARVSSRAGELSLYAGQEKREYLRVPFQYEIRYRKYLKPNQDFKNAYTTNIATHVTDGTSLSLIRPY